MDTCTKNYLNNERRTLHWIPLEKEPTVENPWPKVGQRVLLWGRRNFPVVANYYDSGWFIEARPIAPHHLALNFSHWAAVPGPEGSETAVTEKPTVKVKGALASFPPQN